MRTLHLVLLSLLISSHVFGQNSRSYNNIVKINPFGSIASAIPISIERMFLNEKFSLLIGATYIYNQSGSGQTTYNTEGVVLAPEIRHYFFNDTTLPVKVYISGFFKYEEHSNTTKDRLDNTMKGISKGTGGGILIGNQWFFSNRFVLDLYVGPSYTSYKNTEQYVMNIEKGGLIPSFTAQKNTGTKVRMGLTVGVIF